MLAVSDLHLDQHPEFGRPDSDARFPGCNSRAVAILTALERAYNYAVAGEHKYVVIPGDVFHRRGIVMVPLLNALCKVFDHFKAQHDIITIVLPGNHDYVDRHAKYEAEHLHALYSMSGNVMVASEPQIVRVREHGFNGLIGLIPYTPSRDVWKKRAESLASLASSANSGRSPHLALFAHQSFDGARTGPHEYVMKEGLGTLDVPEGVQVFTGHYHLHQTMGDWVTYVGGLVQQNFGEREYTPGFLEIKLPSWEWRHIEDTEAPRFVVYEGADPVAVLEAQKLAAERGDYLKVLFTGKTTDLMDLGHETKGDGNVSLLDATEDTLGDVRMTFTGMEASVEVVEKYVEHMGKLGKIPGGAKRVIEAGRKILETSRRNAAV